MIDTSAVTTTPYEIHYTAVDALGNIAVPVSRSVTVYNPCLPEAYCTASGERLQRISCDTTMSCHSTRTSSIFNDLCISNGHSCS